MYGYYATRFDQPDVYSRATQRGELFDPTTSAVVGAYAEEATQGIGTLAADIAAGKAQEAKGTALTEEEYKNSEYFSQGIQWHEGMTTGEAKAMKAFNDDAIARQQIIADATTGQSVLGFTAGLGVGIFEPKNLVSGVAASLMTAGAAEIGILGKTMKNMYQLRKKAQAAQSLSRTATIAATEGFVGAAITEPTNRYSARILQQDYTMMDTAFNLVTSAAFSAAIPAIARGLEVGRGVVKGEIELKNVFTTRADKFGARAMDVVIAEHDLAANQLATGRKVDVSPVEQAAIKPMRLYHGSNAAITQFDTTRIGSSTDAGNIGSGAYFSASKEVARYYGDNVHQVDIDLSNPIEIIRDNNYQQNIVDKAKELGVVSKPKWEGSKQVSKEFSDEFRNKAIEAGYDGAIARAPNRTGDVIEAVAYNPEKAIFKPLDSESFVQKELDPKNDTAIDYEAVKSIDNFTETLKDADIQKQIDSYLEEIAFMKREGLLSDDEIDAFADTINSLDEADLESGYNALLMCMTRG